MKAKNDITTSNITLTVPHRSIRAEKSDHSSSPARTTEAATLTSPNPAPRTLAAPLVSLVSTLPVALTAACTEPIVALGADATAPFIARAVSESAAKPTAGGSYWNAAYTFFCARPTRD